MMKRNYEKLDANYNLMTVIGNPTAFQTLKQAQVYKADLFIAVMPFESRNIMACTNGIETRRKKNSGKSGQLRIPFT